MDGKNVFDGLGDFIQAQVGMKIVAEMFEGLTTDQKDQIRAAIVKNIHAELNGHGGYMMRDAVKDAARAMATEILREELAQPGVRERVQAAVKAEIERATERIAGKIVVDHLRAAMDQLQRDALADLQKQVREGRL